MTLSERIYVYGYKEPVNGYIEKEFLHSFLDVRGADGYIKKHRKMFPDRFDKYAMWRGDQEFKVVL